MRRRVVVSFSVLLLAGAAVAPAARAESGPPKKVATVEGITEYRLDNGLRFLVFPEPSTPRVTVNMTVLVGSRHEGYGETGMAHLLEHMVFKGTPGHPNINEAMKARGAQYNGSTNSDRTNYFETLPAGDDNLEFAIALEADRLVNSYVRAEDLRTEFSVVRNEFESGENSPSRVLNQRMMGVAYEWHNYGKSTIGNRSDIERVPIERLQAFYRKFYQPDNVVLVVAGKFDEANAVGLVRKYFGAIPKPARVLDDTYTEEPPQDGERSVTLRRVGDTPSLGLVYHVPAAAHPDTAALQVLANILSAQPSGRLYKALVETKAAASVGAFAQPMHDPGTFEISAELPRGGSVDEARDQVLKTIEAVKANGVTQEEVDRVKRQARGSRERATRDANQLGVQLSSAIAQGDWRLFFLGNDRIQEVTPARVKEVAAKYLTTSNRTVGVFVPTAQPERTPVPQAPAIASLVEGYRGRDAGAAGEEFDASPAAIERRVKRVDPIEGVKVALLPKKSRGNSVTIVLTLNYGNAENLRGLNTAAAFLPTLMTHGTKSMTRQQIQDRLDDYVARISAGGLGGGGGRRGGGGGGGGGSLGSVTFVVETKRANLAPVLDIFRQILREPLLPAADFEVMKVARLAGLERSRTEPNTLAANRLQRLLSSYPKDDVRYVPTLDEDVARVKATTIEQVRTLYRDYLGASHGELAVVGDFDASETLPLLARALEGWTSVKPYARIERPYQGGATAVRETILTPDKANAIYLAGLAIPVGDDDPDYAALTIGNFIFGGGALSSRLGDRLRQKDGLSYGTGASFAAAPLDRRGGVTINAICNPANLPKVVTDVDEELARLLKDGVTDRELEQARSGYLRQLQVRRSADAALASMLASNLFLGRTMTYEADLESAIRKLTPASVNAALRKHIDPTRLSVIGAGDVKTGTVK